MEQEMLKLDLFVHFDEANGLLLRVTENCPWNQCRIFVCFTRKMISIPDQWRMWKKILIVWRNTEIVFLNLNIMVSMIWRQSSRHTGLPSDEAKMCYQMVFTWLTKGISETIFLQDANTLVLPPGLADRNCCLCKTTLSRNPKNYLLWKGKHASSYFAGEF